MDSVAKPYIGLPPLTSKTTKGWHADGAISVEIIVTRGKSLREGSPLCDARVGAALIAAREAGQDPFDAITTVIPWGAAHPGDGRRHRDADLQSREDGTVTSTLEPIARSGRSFWLRRGSAA